MVYLVIKELSTLAEDVIMVTSSIMKDMQSNLDVVYRPNAIRALARIIDVSEILQRYRLKLTLAGSISSIRRKAFQVRPGRSFLLHLLRIPCFRLPSLHSFTYNHQAMVQ